MPETALSARLASIRALADQVDARMDANDPGSPDDESNTPPATPPPAKPATPPDKGEETEQDSTDWKSEARKHEKRSKDNKTALDKAAADLAAEKARTDAILKAAGIGGDEDPAKAAERVTGERDTAVRERDDALKQVATMKRERMLERAAHAAGADVTAFMDSRSVIDALAELDDDAPTTAYADLVKKRLEAAPHLALTPGPRPPGASRGQGSSDKTVGATGVAAGAALYAARRGRKPAATGNA